MLVLCDNQSPPELQVWIEEGEGDMDTRQRDSVHIKKKKKQASIFLTVYKIS